MIDLDQVIQAANSLDPLPASASRLAALMDDPDAGLDQIAEVILFDQALTMKMLRAANSAASASALEITTCTRRSPGWARPKLCRLPLPRTRAR